MITNGDIRQLAELRARTAEAKAKLAEMRKALEESDSFKFWKEQQAAGERCIEDMETFIRAHALTSFTAEGGKAPHPAVKIKEFTVCRYEQPAAIAWAWANMPKAFKFDGKAFEKYALAVADTAAPLPFVEISKEPRAEIASDLSKYLESEATNA